MVTPAWDSASQCRHPSTHLIHLNQAVIEKTQDVVRARFLDLFDDPVIVAIAGSPFSILCLKTFQDVQKAQVTMIQRVALRDGRGRIENFSGPTASGLMRKKHVFPV